MKTTKKIWLSAGILLMGILVMGNVLAFAVSSMYWEEYPLTLNPGETKQAVIVLQNMAGTEPISARVGIMQGSNIASLDEPDKVYEIAVGQRIDVPFTVTISADSTIGGTSNIIFDITTTYNHQRTTRTNDIWFWCTEVNSCFSDCKT